MAFSGYSADYKNVLTWVTATEHNNDHFKLERGYYDTAMNWSTVATIPGAGNSNHILQYSYYDYNLQLDTNYYRLTQIDVDGNSETFNVIVIVNHDNKTKLLIKRINSIGQEVDDTVTGIYFEIYSDGTIEKRIK
jgi:hypothetical protein